MDMLIIFCLAFSFVFTYFMIIWWIPKARKSGITGKDMNKYSRKTIPEMGGLCVLSGFIIGTLLYTGYRTFINNDIGFNTEILAVLTTITLVGMIGIVDDILGWKIGLRQYQKPLLCLIAALPLAVTSIGNPIITIPIIGKINLGLFYFLAVIPIAISGAANAFNMIAGYNGLEAGMGILILATLGSVAWIQQGLGNVAVLSAIMIMCLLAFMIFNFYPAKIFPGDTLTYSVGALIAVVSILGNTEKAALFLFIPYFIQFFLKSRGGWRKEAFSKPDKNNNLHINGKEIYGIEQLTVYVLSKIYKRVKEYEAVIFVFFIEIVLCSIVLINSIIL